MFTDFYYQSLELASRITNHKLLDFLPTRISGSLPVVKLNTQDVDGNQTGIFAVVVASSEAELLAAPASLEDLKAQYIDLYSLILIERGFKATLTHFGTQRSAIDHITQEGVLALADEEEWEYDYDGDFLFDPNEDVAVFTIKSLEPLSLSYVFGIDSQDLFGKKLHVKLEQPRRFHWFGPNDQPSPETHSAPRDLPEQEITA